MKNFSVLGCTGSIGTQTLEIIRNDPDFRAAALAAHSNVKLLFEQIAEFKPDIVCVYDKEKADELRNMLSAAADTAASTFSGSNAASSAGADVFSGMPAGANGTGLSNSARSTSLAIEKIPEVVDGMDGLIKCAEYGPVDTAVISVVGMIGIRPTIAAIKSGKDIALANKETLVTAGHIIMPMIKEYGTRLMPIDSEHSAIYQCLVGENKSALSKILLTASGGPFRKKKLSELKDITPEDALKHPNWSMGAKITIDSSTMVNKALEVMEAHWLFDVPVDRIQIVIQPKSVIHSMVQFVDGSVKAQLGVPSMLLPIEYALYAPDRVPLSEPHELDFTQITSIEIDKPDMELFKGLRLGIEAARTGGSMPTVYNAANEEAVAAFLAKKIGYLDITDGIEKAMRAHSNIEAPTLEEIFETEKSARKFIRELYGIS